MPTTSKAFRINDPVDVLLKDLSERLGQSQTAIVELALIHFDQSLKHGLPVYLSAPPQEPEPPTSAPAAARRPPLQVVENRRKGGGKPPAAAPSNTKRGKK